VDLKLKLEAWKKREDERKKTKKRMFDHGKKIIEVIEKFIQDFNMDKDKVVECKYEYFKFCEMKDKYEKEEKIINNFLC
jgi:hypothetical protein